MKILVIGKSGQIAQALARGAGPGLHVVCLGRPEFDLAAPREIAAALARHDPHVVINAAAFTAVDAAEADPAQAFLVNAAGPEALARACAEHGAPLIHLSTDYVFAGDKNGAYVESDAPAPQSVYGRSKYAGERGVAAAGGAYLVVRTAWVHSGGGKNFVRTMLRLAKERELVSVVDDQRGSPSYAGHIGEALLAVAAHIAGGKRFASGIFHLAGEGACTWAQFAEAIFAESARRGGPSAAVRKIGAADYPTPASRPANSELSCEKLAQAFCVRMPPWRDGLAQCLDDIAVGDWALD